MNFIPESTRWLLASASSERRVESKAIMKDASKANGVYDQDTEAKMDVLIRKEVQTDPTKSPRVFWLYFGTLL